MESLHGPEIIADILSKAGWELERCVSRGMPKGERSSLLTHTATIPAFSLRTPMRS
jgi:hypothetical protein